MVSVIAPATIPLTPATRIFLAVRNTDLRKGFEGLADLVAHSLKEDPLSGHLHGFTNRRKHRIKLLHFDGIGQWVCAKRLAEGSFAWPTTTDPGALRIAAEELTLRLFGISLDQTRAREWRRKAA